MMTSFTFTNEPCRKQARDLVRFSLRLEPSTLTIEQTEQGKPSPANQALSLALASSTSSSTRWQSRQGRTTLARPHRHDVLSIRRDMDHGNQTE